MKAILALSLALFLTNSFAVDCKTDADCEKGSSCKMQKGSCTTNPHSSTCVKLVCKKAPEKKK